MRMNFRFLKDKFTRLLWRLRTKNFALLKQRFVFIFYWFYAQIFFLGDKREVFLRQSSYLYLKKRAESNPINFNKKILHRMAFDRNPLFPTLTDKIAVRNYVEERVGTNLLIPALAICDSVSHLNWQQLPREFVCKVSHGSGGLIGVDKNVDKDSELPVETRRLSWQRYWVNPERFNPASAEAMLKKWLSVSYEWVPGRSPEWAYAGLRPRIIVEELLIGPDSKISTQTQFYVFDGKVKLILNAGRNNDGKRTMNFYSLDWQNLPVWFFGGSKFEQAENPQPKPLNLSSMISIAECLGEGLDFVRVDLYDLGTEIRFGEMTLYPSAGEPFLHPHNFNLELGMHWKLERGFAEYGSIR
jgi:hypothetical protein